MSNCSLCKNVTKHILTSTAAQILFAAGYTMKAEKVGNFFKVRKRFMASKIAESNAKYEQAQQEELLV